jgi:hypothetical protein
MTLEGSAIRKRIVVAQTQAAPTSIQLHIENLGSGIADIDLLTIIMGAVAASRNVKVELMSGSEVFSTFIQKDGLGMTAGERVNAVPVHLHTLTGTQENVNADDSLNAAGRFPLYPGDHILITAASLAQDESILCFLRAYARYGKPTLELHQHPSSASLASTDA